MNILLILLSLESGYHSSSNAERATEATGNSKRQARLPMNHFTKLLEETCPNHAYSIKHKL
jgi:hypothetical protein